MIGFGVDQKTYFSDISYLTRVATTNACEKCNNHPPPLMKKYCKDLKTWLKEKIYVESHAIRNNKSRYSCCIFLDALVV